MLTALLLYNKMIVLKLSLAYLYTHTHTLTNSRTLTNACIHIATVNSECMQVS